MTKEQGDEDQDQKDEDHNLQDRDQTNKVKRGGWELLQAQGNNKYYELER
jgi:hypothetical protein